MSRKSPFTLVLTLLLALTLLCAGCIGPFKPMPTPVPVTLRFAYSSEAADLTSYFRAYETKHPNITIEDIDLDEGGNRLAWLLRDEEVDIFWSNRDALTYIRSEQIIPLDTLLDVEWDEIRDDYYGGLWDAVTRELATYGVPAGLDAIVTYVNQGTLDILGVEAPPPDWDMFSFMELARSLNLPDGVPGARDRSYAGICSDPFNIDPVLFAYLYGGTIVDDLIEPTTPTLDDPKTIEAVDWYIDLFLLHGIAADPTFIRKQFRGGYTQAIQSGYCGLWLGYYSGRLDLGASDEETLNWRMLPLPQSENDFGLGDMYAFYVTSACADTTEAVALLRYLADEVGTSGRYLPARRSLTSSEAYRMVVGDDVADTAEMLSDNIIMFPYEGGEVLFAVGEAFVTAVSDILTQGVPTADALGNAQRKVLRIFD